MATMRRFTIEMAGSAATLYLSGGLTMYLAARTLDECRRLPPGIRHLRIDMRAVRVVEGMAVAAIAHGLRPWRDDRNGSTRVDLPDAPVSFEVLALPRGPAIGIAS